MSIRRQAVSRRSPKPALRVTVLYNDESSLAHGRREDRLAVESVAACAQAVARAVRELGWQATRLAAARDPARLVERLAATRPDVVVNLVESLDGEARLEAALAWVLELAGFAYTGSGPLALSLALDKPSAKAILRERGVAVAPGALLYRGDEPLFAAPLPWIIKPSREDASHGITRESVVYSVEAARERARDLIARYRQPALVEPFIDGRELNIAILGEGDSAKMLAPAEIDFSALGPGHPPLVTFEAKWVEASEAYRNTPSIAARALSPALEAQVRLAALQAYCALGLRDYGRVDLRLDTSGRPVVLEVNPNPDLSPDAGLAKAAKRSGLAYPDLIGRIVRAAAARRRARRVRSARG
jgi:D-alanine-D-alanine ligase